MSANKKMHPGGIFETKQSQIIANRISDLYHQIDILRAKIEVLQEFKNIAEQFEDYDLEDSPNQ